MRTFILINISPTVWQAFQDEIDSEGDVDRRSRLFVVALSKIFHLLQKAYDGKWSVALV